MSYSKGLTKETYIDIAKVYMLEALANIGYKTEDICFCCVQGSTNYNLDIYEDSYVSDVDWKVFVFPNFHDLYYGEKVSKTYKYEDGQFELKDIRLLPDLLAKMNSSYLELLYSPYFYCPDEKMRKFVEEIRGYREQLLIERLPLLMKSLKGMCLEKQNALCHEYEGLKDKITKFGGYDPKQLHHALRILYLMDTLSNSYFNTGKPDYETGLVLTGNKRDILIDIKVNGVSSLEAAQQMMNKCVEDCSSFYSNFWTKDNKPIMQLETQEDNYVSPIKDKAVKLISEAVYKVVSERFA